MNVEEQFVSIAGLICDPARLKMLWNLLDGRAYTAGELGIFAGISPSSASNHLGKLLEADLLKVETQGRHRYYSFSKPEVAYVVEALAMLADNHLGDKPKNIHVPIKFCRTCYDHLAGFIAVEITEALENKGCMQKTGIAYLITDQGWEWFAKLGITKADCKNARRSLTRQCLDWSERKPHLAGQLGALLLERMLKKGWFRKVQFSRQLILTSEGRKALYDLLGLELSH